jgi:[ribosomal protein S18]-alanine N-acetyltransferase
MNPHIRWMIRRDMNEVLRIESLAFEYPWLENDFIIALRQRNCIGMVCEDHDAEVIDYAEASGQYPVVGFMIYELHKKRLHVLNFAVHENWRRRGVGAAMVGKLVGKLASQRRTRITLDVRESNLPAQLFFRSMGFRAVNVLKDYYDESPEDAYHMVHKLAAPVAASH